MRITIHCGTNQLGGCVTEYEEKGWRLFVDYGEQLPECHAANKSSEIEGLTKGDLSKSALLITHYHDDHIGKIADLPLDLPIFMGKISRDIQEYVSVHLSTVDKRHARIAEHLKHVNTFIPGEQFTFGNFTITPLNVDHSAFDAYAFRIESSDGVSVLHTGDCRMHGFRSGNGKGKRVSNLIKKYIGRVSYVVCEGTNVSRPENKCQSEYELQQEFENSFRKNKYNIVYLSSTNIDRLFSLYHAAMRAGRPFYVDHYQKHIMDIVTHSNGLWSKSRLYKYGRNEPVALFSNGNDFDINQKFIDHTTSQGYVLVARANQRFDNLITRLPGEHKKRYLSMWQGYVDKNNVAFNPNLAKSLGEDYLYMHTSGHCDIQGLEELLKLVSPYCAVIPMHTDDPKAFAKLFCNRWPVILLNDGESINPIGNHGFDTTSAEIYAIKQPSDDITEISNEHKLQWWSLDKRSLGEFADTDDALFALKHVVYAPSRIIGYGIEDEEDMTPFSFEVYNPDFTVNAVYDYGDHAPGESRFQEPCRFKTGDRALAIMREYRIVVPCEIISPVTKEKMSTLFENFEESKPDIWDWDWDTVIVRPLVLLKNRLWFGLEEQTLGSEELVQRIFLFPYRNF